MSLKRISEHNNIVECENDFKILFENFWNPYSTTRLKTKIIQHQIVQNRNEYGTIAVNSFANSSHKLQTLRHVQNKTERI